MTGPLFECDNKRDGSFQDAVTTGYPHEIMIDFTRFAVEPTCSHQISTRIQLSLQREQNQGITDNPAIKFTNRTKFVDRCGRLSPDRNIRLGGDRFWATQGSLIAERSNGCRPTTAMISLNYQFLSLANLESILARNTTRSRHPFKAGIS